MLKNNKEISKSTIVCGIIFVLMMLFVFISDTKKDFYNINKNSVDKEKINEIFNKITNNYQVNIEKSINNETFNYTFYTDGKLDVYETNNDQEVYFIYNDKIYIGNSDTIEINATNDELSFVNDAYTNYDLIKKVINKCEFEYKSYTNINCKLLVTDYINEYNTYYNENINSISSEYMNINIYYISNISKLEIDYSSVNNLLTGSNDNIKYTLKFSNINANDYSEIIDYINQKIY